MKLVTFTAAGHTRLGVVRDERVLDLAALAPELPHDMKSFLAAGASAWHRARQAARDARGGLALDAVRLEAPIPNPGKILAIGLNYADHVAESGASRQSTRSGSTSSATPWPDRPIRS